MVQNKIINQWFDSWLIQDEHTAIKQTDKSVFTWKGSGIPKEIRWFFRAENLSVGEKIYLTLLYEGKEYKAYIGKEKGLGRTRLFWKENLSRSLNAYFNKSSAFPNLIFQRIEENIFKIYFLKKLIEPLDDTYSEEQKIEHALSMDMQSLKAAAESLSNKDTKKVVITEQYIRDPYIAQFAKARANGKCQLCGNCAPFDDSRGNPYLEAHHLKWLAEGGRDSVDNIVALCPNCHRKMHVVSLEKDVKALAKWLDDHLDTY